MVTPVVIAVITPELLMVATVLVPLLQVPPDTELVKVTVPPGQAVVAPEIVPAVVALTVTP